MSEADLLLKISSLNVLYIEDDDFQMEQTVALLSFFFNKISTASSAEEAMTIFNKSKYDLVITDIYLPQKSGIDLAYEMRKIDGKVPFIFISSSTDIYHFQKIIQLQAIDFIIKPYSFDDLKNVFTNFAHKVVENLAQLIYINNSVIYNPSLRIVRVKNVDIQITSQEEKLLQLASENINGVISYEMIAKKFGYSEINVHSIKNVILRLRKKISVDIFTNISGLGYRVN